MGWNALRFALGGWEKEKESRPENVMGMGWK